MGRTEAAAVERRARGCSGSATTKREAWAAGTRRRRLSVGNGRWSTMGPPDAVDEGMDEDDP